MAADATYQGSGLQRHQDGSMEMPGSSSSKYVRWEPTTNIFTIRGVFKTANRPTTDGYAAEVKSEFTGTNTSHRCIDATADWKGNGVAGGGNIAVSGVARVAATFTMAAGSLNGLYGQIQNLGTISGAGILTAAVYGLIESGGTWTAVGHVAAGWFDSHLTQTVTAGNVELLYLTNNGTSGTAPTQMGSVFYVYGGDKITNLFTLDTCGGGLVSANDAGGGTLNFTNWRLIKCNLGANEGAGGETHYIVAAKTIANTGA